MNLISYPNHLKSGVKSDQIDTDIANDFQNVRTKHRLFIFCVGKTLRGKSPEVLRLFSTDSVVKLEHFYTIHEWNFMKISQTVIKWTLSRWTIQSLTIKENIWTFGQKSMLEPSPSDQIKFNQVTCSRVHWFW